MTNKTDETKEKLLLAGKKEFLEKGFLGASLRNICKNADVTTGALYFFFKDKEDLFNCIVGSFADELSSIMQQHLDAEEKMLNGKDGFSSIKNPTLEKVIAMFESETPDSMADDMLVGQKVFDLIYDNYDLTILILTKATGTKYEFFVDELIKKSEKHSRVYFNTICSLIKSPTPSDYCVHWFSHLMVDTYISLFLHVSSKEKALQDLPELMRCLHASFYALLKND